MSQNIASNMATNQGFNMAFNIAGEPGDDGGGGIPSNAWVDDAGQGMVDDAGQYIIFT